ncbi:hypothetical protein WA158_000432 [Blastocystis sp. Blastoise]
MQKQQTSNTVRREVFPSPAELMATSDLIETNCEHAVLLYNKCISETKNKSPESCKQYSQNIYFCAQTQIANSEEKCPDSFYNLVDCIQTNPSNLTKCKDLYQAFYTCMDKEMSDDENKDISEINSETPRETSDSPKNEARQLKIIKCSKCFKHRTSLKCPEKACIHCCTLQPCPYHEARKRIYNRQFGKQFKLCKIETYPLKVSSPKKFIRNKPKSPSADTKTNFSKEEYKNKCIELMKYESIKDTNKRIPVSADQFKEDSFQYIGDTVTIFSIHEFFGSNYSKLVKNKIKKNYHSISIKKVDKLARWNSIKENLLHI